MALLPPWDPLRTSAENYKQLLAMANFISLENDTAAITRKKLRAFDRFCTVLTALKPPLAATPQDIKVYLSHWSLTQGEKQRGQ
jgi:hypothetical protein